MQKWCVLLVALVISAAAGAKASKPRQVKEVRDLGDREFAISILTPVSLPVGSRTVHIRFDSINARAAKHVCGSKVWTKLGQSGARVGQTYGGTYFTWTIAVKCDVALPPAVRASDAKADATSDWRYRFKLQTAAGKVHVGEGEVSVDMYGARNELGMHDVDSRMFATQFSSDGRTVDVRVGAPPGTSPSKWTLQGPLQRGGDKDCDWQSKAVDSQGNWVELVQPGGACS